MKYWCAPLLIILLVLIIPLPNSSAAVPPKVTLLKTWGGPGYDLGKNVAVDSLGNIYLSGDTFSFGPYTKSLSLLKYNQTGSLLWQRIWSGREGGPDFGHVMALDPAGNAYVTGGGPDVLLIKINSSGSLLWQKAWGSGGSAVGYAVTIHSNAVYVTGSNTKFNASGTDVLLVKYNFTGGLVWQKMWGGRGVNQGYGVAVDSHDYVYVTGYTNRSGAGSDDLFLSKFDSFGGPVWQKTWGSNGSDIARAVAVDSTGNIYVTGYTWSFHPFSPDILLLKFDSDGNLLWEKIWGGSNHSAAWAYDLAVDAFGSIYVTGYVISTLSFDPGYPLVFLMKWDSSGDLLWQSIWGGSYGSSGYGVAVDHDGNPIVTGYVSAGPPYTQGSLDNSDLLSLTTPPTYVLAVPSFNPTASNLTPVVLSGAMQTPPGNESYAGGQDQFLIKYALLPSAALSPTVGLVTLLTVPIILFIHRRKSTTRMRVLPSS